MPKYKVHVYREMRLVFDDIEADTPHAAALLARDKHFDDCDDWNDCEGTTLAALVDYDESPDGLMVDFEDGRMLRAAPKAIGVLNKLLPEIDAEIEQRQHGGNAENWTALRRLSDEAHGVVAEVAAGTP